MPQQISPFIEAKHGWNYGEDNWDGGMNENLRKFSFMFDRNIDGIVASLPVPVSGEAYYLTTDNRLYFAINSIWYSTSVPKWFEFKLRSDGSVYQFNGITAVPISSTTELDTRLDAVEVTLSALISDLAGNSGSTLVGYKASLADSQLRTLSNKLLEQVSVKDFDAKGDGVTDDTLAFTRAIASGAKKILVPAGTYYFSTGPTWTGMSGISFIGDNAASSIFKWDNESFNIKSPVNCSFSNIGFSPVANDLVTASSFTSVWVTNATNVIFRSCTFKGFGSLTNANKAGSTCLFVYAGDNTTSYAAPGDTKDVKVIDCTFEGDNRKTNFGIRVYTEFTVVQNAINTGCVVQGCTFNGFNWNAVEIAGLKTANVLVTNCVANSCGLTPFDLDKGVHHCIISNVTINRLLGNIDLIANPSTRAAVVSVQGVNPTTGYSYGNIVSNVTAYLQKTDLDTYGNGAMAVSMAYSHSNIVTDINVYCDNVPARGVGKLFGLAVLTFETASGNTVKNVRTTNASSGIVQTAVQDSAMTSSRPNFFENIINLGTMTGEVVLANYGANAGAFICEVVRNCRFSTNLSNPFITTFSPRLYAINLAASGSSTHFFKFENCEIEIPANANFWFALDQIPGLSFENVSVNEGGAPLLNTRFIHSEASTVPSRLGLYNVRENFGQAPLNLSTSLQNLDQTTTIYDGLSDTGLASTGRACMYSSAQPSFPPVANWTSKVERITKVASSFEGWINIGGAWKTYGVTSA